MLVAICVFILFSIGYFSTSRERLFLVGVLIYCFLTAGLLAGCVAARQAEVVLHLDTANRVGLPAEEITAPKPPDSLAKGPLTPRERREQRRVKNQRKVAARKSRKFVQRYLLATTKPPRPAKVKIKNSFNTSAGDVKHKDAGTYKDQRKIKPQLNYRPSPDYFIDRPGLVAPVAKGSSHVVAGLAVVGTAGLLFLLFRLLRFNPLSWLWSLLLALVRRKKND